MKRVHTESRRGNRGHKWFPGSRSRGAIQMDAALFLASILGAAFGRSR